MSSNTSESRVVAELYEGDIFGERALFSEEGEVRGATVTAKTEVECLVLEREDFQKSTSGMETFMPRYVFSVGDLKRIQTQMDWRS